MNKVTLNDLMQFEQFLSDQEKQMSAEFGKAFDLYLPPVRHLSGTDAMYREAEEAAFDKGWDAGIEAAKNGTIDSIEIEKEAYNYANNLHWTPDYDPRDDAAYLYEIAFCHATEVYAKLGGK